MADEADFELFGSQDSALGDDEMAEMEISARPQSTANATKYGVKKFNDWLHKRHLECDFHSITSADLNNLLRRFYAEVKHAQRAKGKSLTPSSLTGLRAALHRCITGAPYLRNFNIIKDSEFQPANKMFSTRCSLYYTVV